MLAGISLFQLQLQRTFAGTGTLIDARTTKVLGALIASMTIGAFVLMLMEGGAPMRGELASVRGAITDRSLTASRSWRRVVLHASRGGNDSLPKRCHFVVLAAPDANGQWVRPTALWTRQKPGPHVYVPNYDFAADSIGICLMGDFSQRSPSRDQFQALLRLVNELQRECKISADRVYLHSELNTEVSLPGAAFPVKLFNARLYRGE